MSGLKAQEEINMDGINANQEWDVWQKQWKLYSCATEFDEKKEIIQVATLLTCIGPEGRQIYYTCL